MGRTYTGWVLSLGTRWSTPSVHDVHRSRRRSGPLRRVPVSTGVVGDDVLKESVPYPTDGVIPHNWTRTPTVLIGSDEGDRTEPKLWRGRGDKIEDRPSLPDLWSSVPCSTQTGRVTSSPVLVSLRTTTPTSCS